MTGSVVLLLPGPGGITRTGAKASRGREGEGDDETLSKFRQGGSVKGRKHGLLLNNAYSIQQIVYGHIYSNAHR